MDENPLNPAPEKPEETARLLPLNRRARRALIASERRQMGLRKPFGTQFWFPRGRKPTQKDPNDYMVDVTLSDGSVRQFKQTGTIGDRKLCDMGDIWKAELEVELCPRCLESDRPWTGCEAAAEIRARREDTSPEESDVTADVREEPDGE